MAPACMASSLEILRVSATSHAFCTAASLRDPSWRGSIGQTGIRNWTPRSLLSSSDGFLHLQFRAKMNKRGARLSSKELAGLGISCALAEAEGTTSLTEESLVLAVTGGTGFIGSRLVEVLASGGHKVKVLTRSAKNARTLFPAGIFPLVEVVEPREWASAIQGCTGVVNLAGTPISTRWNAQVMRDIKSSRVETTKKIVAAIKAAPDSLRPRVLLSSSAIGFYGVSETATFVEDSPSGRDFLAEVCREWEAAAVGASSSGTRVVTLRTGIVLGSGGGVIAKMLPIFQLFAGGPIGTGRQWFSWIHRDDLVALILEALRNPEYQGAINGTAPNPVRMGEMCERLGQTIGRPSWLPVPEFAITALLGEGATLVVDGQKVVPKAAMSRGFQFKYPTIEKALAAVGTPPKIPVASA